MNGVDPLGWMLHDELRRLVRVALGRLSTRDAELLLLKYTENWTYRNLAEHLGLTERGVESRLERARGNLRRELCRVDLAPEGSRPPVAAVAPPNNAIPDNDDLGQIVKCEVRE